MSFFTTSTGENVQGTTSYEGGGGDFAPIPHGTKLRVIMESCAWKTGVDGVDRIKTKARVIEGEFENRVIFDTVDVCSSDTKRRDKHLRKFAALDAVAGTGIVAKGEAPTDEALYGFVGTVLTYTMGLFTPKRSPEEIMSGAPEPKPTNYVMGVSGDEPTQAPPAAQRPTKPGRPAARPAKPALDELDDEIPF